MIQWVDRVIRGVAVALMVMLVIVVIGGTIDLGLTLGRDLLGMPHGRFDVREVLSILGLFLVVLIAIELLYVVRLYLEERHFDVEIVLMVALVAIARKVIVFDIEKNEAGLMVGISAVVLSLAGALFLLRWSRRWTGPSAGHPE